MAAEALETVEQGAEARVPAPDGEEHEFGELDFDRLRKFVVNRQGTDFLLYAGLVTGLHQVSQGYFSIDTRLEQLPTEANGQVTVCSARVQIYDPEQPDVVRRSATGLGDASEKNVNRMMTGAVIRMAETRAKARALRDLLGVSMVTFEEMGPSGSEDGAEKQPVSSDAPFTPRGSGPPERIMVAGRAFTRPQVVSAYRQRVAEAKRMGLVLPDDQADLAQDAPLSVLVGATQSIRRRLEARDGTGK